MKHRATYVEFLRTLEAAKFLGISRTRLWEIRKSDPKFPRPVSLGERAIAFRRTDLIDWAEARRKAA